MSKYVSPVEFEAMKKQVSELTLLCQQQAEMMKNMNIVIYGDSKLGVQGLRERQRKDDTFREDVKDNFREVNYKITETRRILSDEVEKKGEEIMDSVEKTIEPIIENVSSLLEWRKAWNKTIEIITGSRTWRVVFFIIILLVSAGIFIKAKLLGLLPKW